MLIRAGVIADLEELVRLHGLLWPDAEMYREERAELVKLLSREPVGILPAAVFVAQAEEGSAELAGFLDVGLRSHADGCDPRWPVGFVEGWFVAEAWRERGVGAKLLAAAEDWAREQGALEMASDALIENELSISAHEAMGFEVVDRCVHFRKEL